MQKNSGRTPARRLALLLVLMAALLAACSMPAPAAEAPAAEAPAAEAPVAEAPAEAAPTEAPAAEAPAAEPAPLGGLRTYVIVPEESSASYVADEEFFGGALDKYGIAAGRKDTIGRTQAIEGQLELNLDDLSNALGDNRFTVQMNTLESDQSLRDMYIRRSGPQFNTYPEAVFVATAIEGAPATYTEGEEVSFKLIGDITVREVTQPATFDVTASLSGDTLKGTASSTLLMSSFGIEQLNFANTLTVNDEFGINVEFVAREQP